MIALPIKPLTADSCARYGQFITLPQRPADGSGSGFHWWGDNAFLDAVDTDYQVGYLTAQAQPGGVSFDWAERHMHTQELIIPVRGEVLVTLPLLITRMNRNGWQGWNGSKCSACSRGRQCCFRAGCGMARRWQQRASRRC